MELHRPFRLLAQHMLQELMQYLCNHTSVQRSLQNVKHRAWLPKVF